MGLKHAHRAAIGRSGLDIYHRPLGGEGQQSLGFAPEYFWNAAIALAATRSDGALVDPRFGTAWIVGFDIGLFCEDW